MNPFTCFGVEDVDHQPHDGTRGIELTGFLVGFVCEALDQVFVCLGKLSALHGKPAAIAGLECVKCTGGR